MKNNISNERTNFAKISSKVDYPDFLDIQLKSFESFFKIGTTLEERKEEGLYKTFQELFPITDSRNNFVLEFIDYTIDPPRYNIEECIDRGLTFKVPLKGFFKKFLESSSQQFLSKYCFKCSFQRCKRRGGHVTGRGV